MKQLGAVAAQALKHRQWHWCRRPNGFSDMPRWRVIASRLGMPVYQVVAFVNRLEEFANAAEQRGNVGHFDPAEFGEALGMPEDDAARIFAALEDGERPWVETEFVANFFGRNPDSEDNTYNERKRRSRVRTKVLKQLADLARRGLIDAGRRTRVEGSLRALSDPDLFALEVQLAREQLSTAVHGHDVTNRDIVTVTTEQITQIPELAVDNFSDNANGAAAGPSNDGASGELSPQQQAELWLATDGTRIVIEQMMENRTLAETKMARWRDQELAGDAVSLAAIIRDADKAGVFGVRFLNLVVDGIKRSKHTAAAQTELRLPPVPVSERKLG